MNIKDKDNYLDAFALSIPYPLLPKRNIFTTLQGRKQGIMERTEKDFIGTLEIDSRALYGIHSLRARENFPGHTPFHEEWYRAVGLVKLAVYGAYQSFAASVRAKYPKPPLALMDTSTVDALIEAATEVSEGQHFGHFIVPAVQGGAGTSINMNVNEIITNRALTKLGKKPGQYEVLDPIEQANIYQSTNDVVPTAMKLAAMQLFTVLEESINKLRAKIEQLESRYRNDLRIGYTQMQAAVPSSFGRLFSGYNDALSRDWWRVSKCQERIKVVNIGGSAIGTSLSVPRYMVMETIQHLQRLTGMPLTRGENMSETTANMDSLVEVHAIIKAHAVNLEKMASDLRMLATDLHGQPEITLPQLQTGSSIMPGKVNPVLPEFVISVAHQVYANDQLISSLSGQGMLELNAYTPLIGHALLDSLKLLIACNQSMATHMIDGLEVNTRSAWEKLMHSPSISTALLPHTGYHKAGEIASLMKEEGLSIHQANKKLKLLSPDKLDKLLKAENLLKEGFSLKDLE